MRRRVPKPGWDVVHFQGGGALGAYEWGVWETLAEEGMDFSLVSGVSIGAVNAAIVASRGGEATTYLGRFWEAAADPLTTLPFLPDLARQDFATAKSFLFGNPALFLPRWSGLAFYDPTPLRSLVTRNVDFRALNTSPRTLLVGTVDVERGEFHLFDSRREALGPDHVMASAALPPAFPPVEIAGRWYWDGGLVSNAPVRRILSSLPPGNLRRLLLVELFPRIHRRPRDMREVLQILKDFSYMCSIDFEAERHAEAREVQALLERLLGEGGRGAGRRALPPELRDAASRLSSEVRLYHISHATAAEDKWGRDVDFSPLSLRRRRDEGRRAAREALSRWAKDPGFHPFAGRAIPR